MCTLKTLAFPQKMFNILNKSHFAQHINFNSSSLLSGEKYPLPPYTYNLIECVPLIWLNYPNNIPVITLSSCQLYVIKRESFKCIMKWICPLSTAFQSERWLQPGMTFHCYSFQMVVDIGLLWLCDDIRWVEMSHLCKPELVVVHWTVWSAGKRSLQARSTSARSSACLILMWLGLDVTTLHLLCFSLMDSLLYIYLSAKLCSIVFFVPY